MHLVEYYIKEVVSVTDVSEKYEQYENYDGSTMLMVSMIVECEGIEKEHIQIFKESEWKKAEELGWFLDYYS